MPFPRRVLLFLVLATLPALAGCSIRNWYNQEGLVTVELAPQPAKNSSLNDFTRVRVAIFGVTVRQVDSANPKVYTFGDDPRVVDLVAAGRAQERVPLAQFKTNLRATSDVVVRMEVVEVVDAAGETMATCKLADEVEKFPCFFVPDNGAYTYNQKPFAPPRGGEVVVGFPIAIKFAQQGRVSEYYLEADPALIELENRR